MSVKSRVAIIECSDYDQQRVDNAIKKGIDMLGGIELIFEKNEKILLKPNLLTKAAPERAVTTHPAVFEAVGKVLKEKGYEKLYYGDSPGPMGVMSKVAESCGIKQVADKLNIIEGNFNEGKEVFFDEGITEKKFIISKGILEVDGIINICKMKTHQLERITGAVKNMFGAVYGINKGAFHAKYTNAESFAKLVADINNFVKPRLHIMDGIVAMEGNGPQSGTPKHMGVILMSADPVALDSVFCNLINLKPELVPTNRSAQEYGVGIYEEVNIEVLTEEGIISVREAAEKFGTTEFDVYRGTDKKTQIRVLKPFEALLEKKPYVIKERCVKCGICVNSCPLDKKALTLKEFPNYDYKLCIRCYCCQEMCPKEAIDIKIPWIVKMLDRNWKL